MKKLMLVLRDRTAESFLAPFSVPALGVAYRNLADVVARRSEPENILAQHPEDFDLYEIGWFDEESGVLGALETPRFLNTLTDFKVSD